jgi:protein-disulfide isomerase
VRTVRPPLPLLAAALLCLSAATCNKGGEERPAPATPAPAPSAPAEEGVGGGGPTPDDQGRAARTLAVPGMDFSTLSAGAQRELATVFTDEFCYCGCPHTLEQCLKAHGGCRHAKRMANLAAQMAQGGDPGVEIINALSRYYQGFREARRTLKVDERMCKGAKDAKVTVVEFADFECPACGFMRPVLESLVKEHGQKVRVCFAPFPLPSHPNGMPAAVAALAARDRGKFWEMHDLLFANQMALSPGAIKDLGAQVGVPAAEIQKAIDTGKYTQEITGWKELGKSSGVDQTPTLFLNGHPYLLGRGLDPLVHAVDDELEWQASSGWAKD